MLKGLLSGFKSLIWPIGGDDDEPEPKLRRKLYLVETSSVHKIKYVVECDEREITKILEEEDVDFPKEYDQEHVGEKVIAFTELKGKEEYLQLFEKEDHYLKSWSDEKKLELINIR